MAKAILVVLRGLCRGTAGLLLPCGSLQDCQGGDAWYFQAQKEGVLSMTKSAPGLADCPEQFNARGDVHDGTREAMQGIKCCVLHRPCWSATSTCVCADGCATSSVLLP